MKHYALLLLIFTAYFSFGQKWGANTKSNYTNEALDVEIDASGNSYITGYVTGETSFNSSNTITSSAGNGDIYVAKYSSAGALVWYKKFGGNYSDRAYDLAIGPDQNIVITGQYFGNVSFGSVNLSSASGSKDIFLVKLDASGNVLWVRSEGGSQDENAYGVTVDHQNNVILTGQFRGTASIGNQSLTSMTDPLLNAPSFDIFISKYNASGAPLWVKQGSTEYDDRGTAVAVDSQDNIFLCGQYSDTIQFAGNTYNNNGMNAGFLCRFSPSGTIDFFNNIRAGQVLPYDLELNAANEVVLIGDFLGNMNYYDNSGPHSIQNPYSEQIFVVKADQNGNYLWNYTLGSDSELSARSVSIDPAQDIYITGFFKCGLSELHDPHTAIWNSVGFRDPYVLKVSNAGAFTYAKQLGGKDDDEGQGIAVKANDQPIICGSYGKDLNLVDLASVTPTGQNFYSLNSYYLSPGMAGSNYGGIEHNFLSGDNSKNSFLLNYIDASYGEYNYQVKSDLPDSITGDIIHVGETVVLDTLHFCYGLELNYGMLNYPNNINYNYNQLYQETHPHSGPEYTYLWNTGSTDMNIYVTTTGNYYVTVTRTDLCESDIDSVYAILEPIPQLPLISDDLGIYTNSQLYPHNNSLNPHYHLCYPDPVEITYSNIQPDITSMVTSYYYGGGNVMNGPGPHVLNSAQAYALTVTNEYCSNYAIFSLEYDYAVLDTLDLGVKMMFAQNDSLEICENEYAIFYDVDYLANPDGDFINIPYSYSDVIWTINGLNYYDFDSIRTNFQPDVSGWYTVELEVVFGYQNLCGLDTVRYYAVDSFYITVHPNPVADVNIIGDSQMCPNEPYYLTVDPVIPGGQWYGMIWSGISWVSPDGDSVLINQSGEYAYSGTLVDPVTGCAGSFYEGIEVTVKQPPHISATSGIICPNGSLLLSVPSTFATYEWIGPGGNVLSTTNTLNAQEQGYYYCNVVDAEGCPLTTPSNELLEYSTPSLSASPANFICAGESVTITASYTGTVGFQWSPISSTADEIVVNQPGVYTASMQQCGFTIQQSVTIIDASFVPQIFGDTLTCDGTLVEVTATPVNASFFWNDPSIDGNTFSAGAGSYYAMAINTYGCEVQTDTLTIVSLPNVAAPVIADISTCAGTDVVLTDVSGNAINWYSVEDTTLLYTNATMNLDNIAGDTAFIASFDIEACSQEFTLVEVSVTDSLPVFDILGDSLFCPGEQVILTATTNENVSWFLQSAPVGSANPLSLTLAQLQASPTITAVIENTCFTNTVTDTLIYVQPLTIHLAEDSIILCQEDEYPVSLLENTSAVTWTGPFGTQVGEELIVSPELGNGTITAQAVDLNGCITNSVSFYLATSELDYAIESNFDGLCEGNSGFIQVNTLAESVLWNTPIGTFDMTYIVVPYSTASSGMYYVALSDVAGCIYHDSLDVNVNPQPVPVFSLPGDSMMCIGSVFNYHFPEDGNTYVWNLYGEASTIPVQGNMELVLVATSPFGCVYSDSMLISGVNCESELPNVITSNGDGINDYFVIEEALMFPDNKLVIYNRWGNVIYEKDGYKNNFEGSAVSDGAYWYVFSRDPKHDPTNVVHGFLHIFH